MSIQRMLHVAVFVFVASPAFAGHDFNNDGFDDLAIGVPFEDIAPTTNGGAVHVLFGGVVGLTGAGSQFFTPQNLLIPAENSQNFGIALASGDFDGDGFDDLAIGASSSVSGLTGAGSVYVLRGSAAGLDATSMQTWTQNSPGIKDQVEVDPGFPTVSNESFGYQLLAADFSGDGFDDLVIGALESIGKGAKSKKNAGALHVLFGSTLGLTSKKNQFWSQDSKGVPGFAAANSLFGFALAAGDIDGDGRTDLAVAATSEDTGPVGLGSVTILRGAKGGLTAKKAQRMTQFDVGLLSYPHLGFAHAMALSDLNDDGFDDLAIGSPLAPTPFEVDGGVFTLVYGSKLGAVVHQPAHYFGGGLFFDDLGTGTKSFGIALERGDFDNDTNDDLLVGSSGDTIAGQTDAGSFRELHGFIGGPVSAFPSAFSQGTNGVADTAETGDLFGSVIAVGDFNGDGYDDAAVSARGESVAAVADAGNVVILYSDGDGLVGNGSVSFTQATPGVADLAEPADGFGWALCR